MNILNFFEIFEILKFYENFAIKIKHISTEFVKALLLKCAYFT